MNLAMIHDEVVNALKSSTAKVTQRREAIAALAKAFAMAALAKVEKMQNSDLPPLLRRRKAWFSTTQTDAANADFCIRSQLLGVDVGALRFSCEAKSEENAFWFHPKKHLVALLGFPDYGPWKWSNDPKAARLIRQFFDKCETIKGAKAHNEREIQWQLANALQTGDDALRNLQPVTWNGCYTEIGVSVNKTGQPGTGNIDLLVRRGKGGQRGFIVFELKKPGDKGIEKALKQALRYATALNCEANEGGQVNQSNYHAVFGSGGKAKLKIGAAVVLDAGDGDRVRNRATAILQQYWAKRGESQIDRIGVLLYKFDPKANKAKNWEWLCGWDARERPPSSEQAVDGGRGASAP